MDKARLDFSGGTLVLKSLPQAQMGKIFGGKFWT